MGSQTQLLMRNGDGSSDFFSLPKEKKQEVAVPYPGYPYGWIGPNKEALAASKGKKNST